MATKLTLDGTNLGFRIKRPLITTGGFVSDTDPDIKKHLDELNKILGRKIFDPDDSEAIQDLLSRPLTPKRIPDGWDDDSLVYLAKNENEEPGRVMLSEYIDSIGELSALKFAFDTNIAATWSTLDFNVKTILSYPAIKDYLIAFGYIIRGLEEVNGLKNFVLTSRAGSKNVANYATVSAARTVIDREKLIVPDYNVDDSKIVEEIRAAGLSLSLASFKPAVKAVINNFIFNSKEAELIKNSNIGEIPEAIIPLLIKYIKNSTVPITAQNVNHFLPIFISQIQGTIEIPEVPEGDFEQSDQDFDVQFLEDDASQILISKSAVKCAAQLYYSMILGDELEVFNVANHLTHKYLVRKNIDLQDGRLRENLQEYVFFNRFKAPKTKKMLERTRPAERQMFYRQVFNYGSARTTDDVIVNGEFPRLWKVLMLESAKYLERAQASPHPDNFVSRQNVMQAVEDLQYNLSTHCTGMALVITPLIYSELDFVTRRIFNHPVVRRHVSPSGGSWLRVVEEIYADMRRMRPKATVVYNKAKLGHDIIRSIADYNPATFEDDKNFAAFISNVDAFITTQSILQGALTDDLKEAAYDDEERQEQVGMNGEDSNGYHSSMPNMPATAARAGATAGSDEWDF